MIDGTENNSTSDPVGLPMLARRPQQFESVAASVQEAESHSPPRENMQDEHTSFIVNRTLVTLQSYGRLPVEDIAPDAFVGCVLVPHPQSCMLS